MPTAFIPAEIIIHIARFTELGTLSSLTRASRWCTSLLTPLLYDRGLNFVGGKTAKRKCPHGLEADEAGGYGDEDWSWEWLNGLQSPGKLTDRMLAAASIWKSEFITDYLMANLDTVFISPGSSRNTRAVNCLGVMTMARNRPIMKALLARADVRSKYLDPGIQLWHTPMRIAIDLDDSISVQMLLDAGADPSAGLYRAVRDCSAGLIKLILDAVKTRGGDISSCVAVYGEAPLHVAARRGDPEVVELLLKAGADLWVKTCGNKEMPIQMALRKPAIAVKLLKTMLDCGGSEAEAEAETDWKLEVLHSAISQGGNAELVQILVHQGVDIFARIWEGNTALELMERGGRSRMYGAWPAIYYKNAPDMAAALLKADPYIWPQEHINRRLWELARQGPVEGSHLTLLNLLVRSGMSALEIGGDADFANFTALHFLCGPANAFGDRIDHRDAGPMMVSLLLANGASISAQCDQGVTPLMRAIAHDQLEIIRLLLQARPQDPAINMADISGTTPLSEAAGRRTPAAVKLLLDAGADVFTMGPGGTALHHAVRCGCKESARLLLDAGCPASAVTSSLETALHQAVRHDFSAAIKLLVDAGCPVSSRDIEGATALRKAVWRRDMTAINELIGVAGADIVKSDDDGSGDLVCVALTSGGGSPHTVEAVVRFLVDHGASIHADCEKCATPAKEYLEEKVARSPTVRGFDARLAVFSERMPRKCDSVLGLPDPTTKPESGSGKLPKTGRKLVSLHTVSKRLKSRLSKAGRKAAS